MCMFVQTNEITFSIIDRKRCWKTITAHGTGNHITDIHANAKNDYEQSSRGLHQTLVIS